VTLGPLTDAVATATDEALAAVPRIWDRDHTWWSEDPTELADRLGWLDAPDGRSRPRRSSWRWPSTVRADGITDVVLVGMGGSSLYPAVLARHVRRCREPAPARARLDRPGAVLGLERSVPWETTLVVPASKSGGTIETLSHLARFERGW
jgi:glucose-6-phosphate isomerase